MASRFELHWSDWSEEPGFAGVFLDYILDGRSLWRDYHVGDERRELPVLGWQPAADDDAAAARLLLEAPPDLGERTSVFVCAFCGDLDCGATSVIIEHDGDEIVWRDPASTSLDWASDPKRTFSRRPPRPPPAEITICVFRDDFGHWPVEFRFDADEYRRVIIERPRRSRRASR